MIINIDVQDSISPALLHMLEHNESYLRHVTKSVGWYAQKEIKAGVASGSPNGSTFVERIPFKIRKALSQSAKENWYGSMVRAIGYSYEGGAVNVGWTSKSAAAYGKIQEYGHERQVTSNMRKYWASKGIYLSRLTTVLNVPARPIFEPMSVKLEKEIPPYVEEKLKSYMQENIDFGVHNVKRRKYKVYG